MKKLFLFVVCVLVVGCGDDDNSNVVYKSSSNSITNSWFFIEGDSSPIITNLNQNGMDYLKIEAKPNGKIDETTFYFSSYYCVGILKLNGSDNFGTLTFESTCHRQNVLPQSRLFEYTYEVDDNLLSLCLPSDKTHCLIYKN